MRRAFLFSGISSLLGLAMTLAFPLASSAHGVSGHGLEVDHPWAPPSAGGDGTLHFRQLRNTGETDRILQSVRCQPACQVVFESRLPSQPWRAVSTLSLSAGQSLDLSPAALQRIRVVKPSPAWSVGDRVPLTLVWAGGHTTDIVVWVQQPRKAKPQAGEGHAGH